MHFKRNDFQEYIESELGCKNIKQWSSYKSQLEEWTITTSNKDQIERYVKSDIISYFFKALQSFVLALNEIENNNFAWSIIKLYYSVFYLLRCDILLSKHILVRCKSLYYAKIDINARLIAYNPSKFKGDHQLTIGLEKKLYDSDELKDPILGNEINGENPYVWFMKNRDRVNYQMKDFSDPECDDILNHVSLYFKDKTLFKLFLFYNNNTDYSICFDTDHSILAIPYKKLISVYKRIQSTIIITSEYKQKIIETQKLLFHLNLKKTDILNLIH